MSFDDFMSSIDKVSMCHLAVDSFSSELLDVNFI